MGTKPTIVTLSDQQMEAVKKAVHEARPHERRGYPEAEWQPHRAGLSLPAYVTADDVLSLYVQAQTGGTGIDLFARLLLPNGQVTRISQTFTPTGTPLSVFAQLPLVEGWLLGVTVGQVSGPPLPSGDTRAGVWIMVGTLGYAGYARQIIDGYIGDNHTLSWPDAPPLPPVSSQGELLSMAVANPAAGADWSFTCPVGNRQAILCASMLLTTSATAANRIPNFTVLGAAGNPFWSMAVVAAQTASKAITYTLARGTNPYTDANSNVTLPLPTDLRLGYNFVIKSTTANLQATDQWSKVTLLVEQWWDS
jgi:hypothetical protein